MIHLVFSLLVLANDMQVEALQSIANEIPKTSGSTEHTLTMADGEVMKAQDSQAYDTLECPLVRGLEQIDYQYVSKVVQILDGTGRPYFLSGGSSIALLRFGALEIHPDPKRDQRFAFDNDLDFMVYLPQDSDYDAFCNEVKMGCQEAGIFQTCGPCKIIWSGSQGARWSNDSPVDLIRLSDEDDKSLRVHWAWWARPWFINRDDVFPVQMAKYSDTRIPVPRSPLKFLSKSVPPNWQSPIQGYHGYEHEYGDGCDGVAYPAWITGNAYAPVQWGDVGWITGSEPRLVQPQDLSHVSGLNITRGMLQQCALALDSAGFASFSECFSKSKAISDRASVD